MKARTKLLIALGLVVLLAARELGAFDFSLGTTSWNHTSTKTFTNGMKPEKAYSAVGVTVLEAGDGEPQFLTHPSGTVDWTIVLDEPEFGGLQWTPLYKHMTYRIEAQAGDLDGSTFDGQPMRGRPEDGSPHGFAYIIEGSVTAIGLQSVRGLREAAIESAKEDIRESLTEDLMELEPAGL